MSQVDRYMQRGAAMVEMALVMIFLIFMVFSSIDLYFLSSAYSTYSQIAREGVMSGIRMNSSFSTTNGSCTAGGVTKTTFNGAYTECDGPSPSSTCGHNLVHWRIKKAIDVYHSSRVSGPGITTLCIGSGTNSLEVELSATFNGYSPVFKNIAIRVRQRGEITL